MFLRFCHEDSSSTSQNVSVHRVFTFQYISIKNNHVENNEVNEKQDHVSSAKILFSQRCLELNINTYLIC